jgi:predicted transposase YbfD/YdcC
MAQYKTKEDIAADEKGINSTVKNANNSEQSFASLVSFFGQQSQLIYQIGVLENNKESEIHVLQEMTSKLQIKKALFTMYALHCQKNTARAIIDSGNDYLITVKKNQPNLYKSIAKKAEEKPIDEHYWKQTGHGHDSHCRIRVWEADENMKKQWIGLHSYISVRRYGVRNGKEFDMTTFYISSTNRSAWCFAKSIRGHRKVENNLHWVKDVIQNEDGCELVDHQSAINMAVMRDVSFNLLVMNGFKSISDGIGAMGEQISNLWGVVSNEAMNLKNIFG